MEDLLIVIKQAMSADLVLQEAVRGSSDLQEALATRRLVALATSNLMGSQNLSENDAVKHLQQISRDEGITMQDVASRIVHSETAKPDYPAYKMPDS